MGKNKKWPGCITLIRWPQKWCFCRFLATKLHIFSYVCLTREDVFLQLIFLMHHDQQSLSIPSQKKSCISLTGNKKCFFENSFEVKYGPATEATSKSGINVWLNPLNREIDYIIEKDEVGVDREKRNVFLGREVYPHWTFLPARFSFKTVTAPFHISHGFSKIVLFWPRPFLARHTHTHAEPDTHAHPDPCTHTHLRTSPTASLPLPVTDIAVFQTHAFSVIDTCCHDWG